MNAYTPKPEDRFTFGLWTVGWQARDPFGDASRGRRWTRSRACTGSPSSAPTASPSTTTTCSPSSRTGTRRSTNFKKALAETGLKVPMATTNLFTHPVFKDGAFTSNDRDVRRYALRKVMRNLDLAAELGAKTYVCWGGREGAESDAAKDIRAALGRYKEAHGPARLLRDRARATTSGSPSSPSRTSRAATSCCRPSATRSRSSTSWSTPTGSASTPRSATSRWPGSTSCTASPRRSGTASSSTSTSTASTAPSTTRTSIFGHGDVKNAFFLVDLLENGGYDGPRHFDYKPLRTEDAADVWVSAAANMRTYLILKEKVEGVPRRPRGAGGARREQGRRAGRAHAGARARRSRTSNRDDFDVDKVGRARLPLHPPQPARHRAPARRRG